MKKYILNKDGSIQEESDLFKWARWFETENRIIEKTILDKSDIMVSTVFLGIDHNFGEAGPPILFETMIFGGEHDQWQARASTIEEAKRYHRHAIELARNII